MKPWIWRSKHTLRGAVAGLGEALRVGAGPRRAAGRSRRSAPAPAAGRDEVRVQQRRGAPVAGSAPASGDVVVVEVGHRVAASAGSPGRCVGVRGRAAALVGRRVDQQLEGERQVAGVARGERHHRGEVAAGAVAADGEARCASMPQRGGLALHPARRGDAVVDRGREAVLRAPAGSRPTTTAQPAPLASSRHSVSCVSRSPITQPPPW